MDGMMMKMQKHIFFVRRIGWEAGLFENWIPYRNLKNHDVRGKIPDVSSATSAPNRHHAETEN